MPEEVIRNKGTTLFDKMLINDRYHVGDQIEVYVNPGNPKQSVVERRSLSFTYLWKQLLIVGFSGFVAIRFWYEPYKEPNKSLNRSRRFGGN